MRRAAAAASAFGSAGFRRRPRMLLAALILCGALGAQEARLTSSARRSEWMAARQAGGGSPVLAQLAGSLRIVAANALWLKVDAYHEDRERRGLSWAQNADLLPMLRAITYLDPHFVEAYLLHSYLLTRQGRAPEGLALLGEAIQRNPNRFEPHEAAAMLYARTFRQPVQARAQFARALALARDPFDRNRLARTLERADLAAPSASSPPAAL